MITKTIKKIATSKFKVITDNVPGSELELDFSPYQKQFSLSDNDLLIHWQAKPKGYRQWGIYSIKTDSYISVSSIVFNRVMQETLQLDDEKTTTIPSAVIKVSNAQLISVDLGAIICSKERIIAV